MHKRNHNEAENSFFEGAEFFMAIRQPGACQMTIPANHHFLDIYIGRTKGSYKVSGFEYLDDSLPPGSFVFIPANGEREVIASRSGLSIQISFSEQLFEKLLPKQPPDGARGLHTIHHIHDEFMIGVAQFLETFWAEGLSEPCGEVIKAVVVLMGARVAHHFSQAIHPRVPIASFPKRIQKVLNHIENNLQTNLSLKELGSVAGVSPYHFARIFRKSMARSPHQYVLERRLAKAKQLLSQSDDSIAQIAYDCGFSSQSHMTDVFNRILDITPGELRKNDIRF